jgi:serine/threonine protein kinase
VQGGLTLVRVLTLLKQATAALLHLHSLGILHRDLRAANILIAGLDPLHAMVADFGLSHQLSAFASGDMYKGASKVSSVLAGTAALGPWQVGVSSALLHLTASSFTSLFASCDPLAVDAQWIAPEVRAGSEDSGRVVTTASDVYMVGGFTYELLTAGTLPFHWLSRLPQLLIERLTSADPVEIPGTDMEVPGLLHKSVLEAAELDRKPIPWCVQADATPGSAGRLAEVKGLMAACLALSPEDRPKLPDLHRSVTVLQAAEAAEARATGSTGGGRPAATAPREWAGSSIV